jgi:hypothetical protein
MTVPWPLVGPKTAPGGYEDEEMLICRDREALVP